MDYKEAIERLIDHFAVHNDGRPHPKLDEAEELAYKAMEKQIPMKPKNMEYKLLLDSGWRYECPVCGCAVGENEYNIDVTEQEDYCGQCGQKIDWK